MTAHALRPPRGFIKLLAVLMAAGLALLLTTVWLNAYVFGGSTTIYVNKLGEAGAELALFYGVVWPVISVGLYFLAVDSEVAA